ncbi:helix-turn-helix transcriptional regulator [Nocardioides dongxiaopingii]|uniref:helix-turn-helix transcriptional regulator n=1 Tax=Nocardioides dongxiaopingii TaxID=2576036 RepID=UPI0010C76903|nr:response regulator transcription factor [Nocardioides dongxiaopingii]
MNASPLRITLVDESDLAAAGLRTILEPYADRVALVDNREALAAPEAIDVVLYEPVGQTSMSRALLRDLQAMSRAQAAVFSWAGPEAVSSATPNPHLPKTLSAAQIVRSVERLAAGRFEPITTPAPQVEVVAPAASTPERRTTEDDGGLTAREREIVGHIVSGLSNREIGDALSLSINSVKTYIRSAYRKMGVERRTQAVLWGLSRGLGSDPTPALVG